MNCKCIEETVEKLKTRVLESDFPRPKKSTGLRTIECANVGMMWRDSRIVLSIPFNVYWEGHNKTETVKMIADFCPFCGKSTSKQP